jgi:transposase
VRLVMESESHHESQWAAITSVAAKIGCTAETLRKWVRQAERDSGKRAGLTTAERERLKELERENRELKRANEILRKASAFFALLRSGTFWSHGGAFATALITLTDWRVGGGPHARHDSFRFASSLARRA